MATISGTPILVNDNTTMTGTQLDKLFFLANNQTNLTISTTSAFSLKLATKEAGTSGVDMTRQIFQTWG